MHYYIGVVDINYDSSAMELGSNLLTELFELNNTEGDNGNR